MEDKRPITDWWYEFWRIWWPKHDFPNPATVLDFNCVEQVDFDNGQNVITYLHPTEGEFDATMPYGDNIFDALVFHSSINKDPRIRLNSYPELPKGKARSIIGTGWILKEQCRARWSELYRISKPNAVWFVSCYKHVEHHIEVEKFLTDEDRHNKKIIFEGW